MVVTFGRVTRPFTYDTMIEVIPSKCISIHDHSTFETNACGHVDNGKLFDKATSLPEHPNHPKVHDALCIGEIFGKSKIFNHSYLANHDVNRMYRLHGSASLLVIFWNVDLKCTDSNIDRSHTQVQRQDNCCLNGWPHCNFFPCQGDEIW